MSRIFRYGIRRYILCCVLGMLLFGVGYLVSYIRNNTDAVDTRGKREMKNGDFDVTAMNESASDRPLPKQERQKDPVIERDAAQIAEMREAAREKEQKEWMKEMNIESIAVTRPKRELLAIRAWIEKYHEQYGEFPQGGGAAVSVALLGKVGGRKAIMDSKSWKVSAIGELLDPWGTPYVILVRGEKVDVRSAGADKIAYTADDIVL